MEVEEGEDLKKHIGDLKSELKQAKSLIYGEKHGHVADSYHYLGNVYRDIGKHEQARQFFEKEEIMRKICGN